MRLPGPDNLELGRQDPETIGDGPGGTGMEAGPQGQERCQVKLAPGEMGQGEGQAERFLVAQHCQLGTVASRPPGGAWPLLCSRTQKSRPRSRKKHWSSSSQDQPFPRHPSPFRSLWRKPTWNCNHVCLFSFALPAQKQGPTGGKEGVCVCCVRPGLRGSREGG